jgi:hypothetical protein
MADTPIPNTPAVDYGQYYKDPALEASRSGAETAGANAAQYTSAGTLLPYKLKDAILQKLNYNQDLISKQNQAQGNYFATPANAREQYSNVWDPAKREALTATARSQAYVPYANYTDLLNTRMGSVSDIIGAGTASFKSLADLAGAEAERARQKYIDLFNQAGALTGTLTAQDQAARTEAWNKYNAAESARQFAEDMSYKQKALQNNLDVAKAQGSLSGLSGLSGGSSSSSGSGGILNPNDANSIKAMFPGYAGWNDSAAIVADFRATGGQGKQ